MSSIFLKSEPFQIRDLEFQVYQLSGQQGKEIIKKVKEVVAKKNESLDLYEMIEPFEKFVNDCVYYQDRSLVSQNQTILEFSLDDIVLLLEKILEVNKIFFKTLESHLGFKIYLREPKKEPIQEQKQ